MKTTVLILLLCLLSVNVWSQTTEEKISTHTIFLDKVYEHTLGYVVTYGNLNPYYNEIVLPLTWFGSTYAALGKIHYGKESGFPLLMLHFRNTTLVGIDLYIPENALHPARATLHTKQNPRELFNVTLEETIF